MKSNQRSLSEPHASKKGADSPEETRVPTPTELSRCRDEITTSPSFKLWISMQYTPCPLTDEELFVAITRCHPDHRNDPSMRRFGSERVRPGFDEWMDAIADECKQWEKQDQARRECRQAEESHGNGQTAQSEPA